MKKIFVAEAFLCLATFLLTLPAGGEAPAGQASAAEIIRQVLTRDGIEAAKEKFAELRGAARGSCSFSEKEFIELGAALGQSGDHAAAADILRLCLDVFPDSPDILFALARAYRGQGDEDSYYLYFRRMISARGKMQLKEYLEKNRGQLAATAAGVIRGHVAATGGEKAWRDVQTMVLRFSVHDTSGGGRTLVRWYKRPAYYRQGFEDSPSFHCTDGKTVWRVSDGEWREIEDSAYKRMASIDDSFLDSAAAGVTYDWVGVEMLNNAPVYRLRRTYADDFREDLFFSIATGCLTEKLTPYNIGPTYYSFWDYRRSGGILLPHVQIRNMGDMAPPHGLVLKEVRINEPLDDSLFVKQEK